MARLVRTTPTTTTAIACIVGGPPASTWEATHSQANGLTVQMATHPTTIPITSATAWMRAAPLRARRAIGSLAYASHT